MMREDEAVSARTSLATVGKLMSAEKMNSDTPIENTVKAVRRLLRNRFLKISPRYFTGTPPHCA
jgi:hypothetical protein